MVKPKKIINDPNNCVSEFIEGLLLQYPNHLVKLANHNVVLAAQRPDRPIVVQLMSGGGSGHEPSHAGWIGRGMLTAAVCGGIFTSPSVASILATLRAIAQDNNNNNKDNKDKGILMIVKNYTGDRLNFGVAAERAAQEGIRVAMVVVADDCALPRTKGITGARGVAGTVLVHKIAGAAAAAGLSLERVEAIAKLTASRMGTLGIALDSVTVPNAQQINDRLDENTIEVGLGIHGEAGMRQSPILTAEEMAREMITTIQSHGRVVVKDDQGSQEIVPNFEPGDEVCILVNNLGGTSNFEMSILTRSCVKLLESEEFGVSATRVFVGNFMTSFDMRGVSLTILNLSGQDELVTLLDAPTNAPAWQKCDVWNKAETPSRLSLNEISEVLVDETTTTTTPPTTATPALALPELAIPDFAPLATKLIKAAAGALMVAEPALTKYDTIVGDGDCGVTMKRGATEVLDRLEKGTIPTAHPVHLFAALADAVSASMGGTSGVLIELMFRKMSNTLLVEPAARSGDAISGDTISSATIGVVDLCHAFQSGVAAVSLYGGAHVGSRTMLDALVPAAIALVDTQSITEAAAKAKEGAETTAAMKVGSAGRSNYLSEETLEGTPDPGAEAVAIVFSALAA